MAAFPQWTRVDDKRFELALLQIPEGSPNFIENIAYYLQKPVKEVEYYYCALVQDIERIESGTYVLPKYPEDDYVKLTEAGESKGNGKKTGIPWSEEEHRLVNDFMNKNFFGLWR